MYSSKPNPQGTQSSSPSFSSSDTHPSQMGASSFPPNNSNHTNPYLLRPTPLTHNNPSCSNPYLVCTPSQNSTAVNPIDSALHKLNSWSRKAESTANNIWKNLRTGSSVSEVAWGKMNLAAKAVSGGGFETLYKHTFSTYPGEILKKTFACYISTTTGPIPGTLFLSNAHLAFCSDQPLSLSAPSGLQTWSYYKLMVPLTKICNMNPVTHYSEKYIQVVTVDGHEFWFMGFVNFEKASHHIFESISSVAATGIPVQAAAAQYNNR